MAETCRKGLHSMEDPANVGVQRGSGRRYCRECKREYRREMRRRRRDAVGDMCRRGLHDLSDEANVYVRADGRRECRACKADAERRRREDRAAAEAQRVAAEVSARHALRAIPVVPPAGIRAGVKAEVAGRHRLALMIRAARSGT